MFEYTMDIQKGSLLKKRREQHKHLIKKYKIHFCPLLLPKIAVLGYQLRPNPTCQIFFSRIQLTDKTIIQRQNDFIDYMKNRNDQFCQFRSSRTELHDIDDPGTSVFTLKGQQNNHRYSQILTSRLKDLNQFIFHIEKSNKEPLLEIHCREMLKQEITKLEIHPFKKQKQDISSEPIRIAESQQLFNLNQHKHNKHQEKEEKLKYIFQQQKNRQVTRVITEPNQRSSLSSNYKYLNSNVCSTSKEDDPFQIQQAELPNQLRQTDFVSQSKSGRYSNANHLEDNKENTTGRTPSHIGSRRGGIIKTEAPWQRMKKNPGKSVRLMIQDSTKRLKTESNEKYSRSSKMSGNSGQKPRKSFRFFKEPSTSKMIGTGSQFSKFKAGISRKSLHHEDQQSNNQFNKEQSQFPDKTDGHEEEDEFSESDEQETEQKDFIFHRQLAKLGVRRNKKPKLSAFWNWDSNQLEKPVPKSKDKPKRKSIKKRTNILQREGAMIQVQEHQQSSGLQPQKIRPIFSRVKREGKLLGAQANKHLQRLIRESNVEQMLIQNELQEDTHSLSQIKYSLKKNGFKMPYNNKELNSGQKKQYLATKNNIMMEVNLEAEHQQLSHLKNSHLHNFVDSAGQTVNLDDLKTFRQDYVKVGPYHHKALEYYYGGEQIKQLDYQIITDELGQYFFNRNFIKRIHHQQEDHQHYPLLQVDKVDFLAFDLSSNLIRASQDIDQKQMMKSSILGDHEVLPSAVY